MISQNAFRLRGKLIYLITQQRVCLERKANIATIAKQYSHSKFIKDFSKEFLERLFRRRR